MEEMKRQVVLLSLIESMKTSSCFSGDTQIHRSLYFLQSIMNVPTAFEYVLYKHGPFSFELKDILGEMRGNLLIELKCNILYGPYYELTEVGRAQLERYPKTAEQYQRQIETICEFFASKKISEIDRMATALYISKEEKQQSLEVRAKRFIQKNTFIPEELAKATIIIVDEFIEKNQIRIA